MAKIKDVAVLANVAVGTVSKYLKNPSSVKQVNREKIQKAIKQLNYSPSPVARSMRTKKAYTIGIIVPTTKNPYYSEVFNAIRYNALKHGYTSVLYTADDNLDALMSSLSNLQISPLDGIILFLLDRNKILEDYITNINPNIPIVTIGWEESKTNNPSIVIDVYKGIHTVTSYLITNGKKRFAYFSGLLSSDLYKMKYNAYKDALEEHKISFDPEYIFEAKNTFESATEISYKFLSIISNVDAVVCATDMLAISLLRTLYENNVDITNIAVTGHDNILISEVFYPSLTTLAQPIEEIGAQSFSILNNLMCDITCDIKSVHLDTTLIIRESTSFHQV